MTTDSGRTPSGPAKRAMRDLAPARHPLIAMAVITVAGAAAAFLVLLLVIVPLVNGIDQAPAQLVHAYQGYVNGVGQEFQQAGYHQVGPDPDNPWGAVMTTPPPSRQQGPGGPGR